MLEQIDGAPCQIGLLDGPAALARAIMTPEAMPHLQVSRCCMHGNHDTEPHAKVSLMHLRLRRCFCALSRVDEPSGVSYRVTQLMPVC